MIPTSGNNLIDSAEDLERLELLQKKYLNCGCVRVCRCDEDDE